jgi:hypothetical protein
MHCSIMRIALFQKKEIRLLEIMNKWTWKIMADAFEQDMFHTFALEVDQSDTFLCNLHECDVSIVDQTHMPDLRRLSSVTIRFLSMAI